MSSYVYGYVTLAPKEFERDFICYMLSCCGLLSSSNLGSLPTVCNTFVRGNLEVARYIFYLTNFVLYICFRFSLKGKNLRTEPKHIVFLSQLLLLFQFCHTCKADNPTLETSEIGTEAVVKTTCNNPKCQKQNTWYSQPLMPGYRIPAGNLLLCLCILLTGGSATKVFQMFNHMGLGCVSLTTFFNYQRVCISYRTFY